jgi:hypothetical protein
MSRQKKRIIIASVVGLVSEFMPIPGLLSAALIFPQGGEGDHGYMYLALADTLNFGLLFAITYCLFGLFSKPKNSN